jgi:hypothetical protein
MAILTHALRGLGAGLRPAALLLAAAVSIAGATPEAARAAGNETLEYAVEAAFLAKFGGYVEWEKSVFASPTSAITLCIMGKDPFGDALDSVIAATRIDGRPIVLRRLQSIARGSGCQILFVGGSDTQSVAQALDAVRGEKILTVTNAEMARDVAGIIEFVVKDNRVRFDIDLKAASANGLTISSKLLSIALAVKPEK